ncbi:MAG: YdeI/OmpD-associated family protein [Verrucomicrobiota bacterium]
MAYTVVFIPKAIEKQLPLSEHPRLRILGCIDSEDFDGACQPDGGRWYLLLSRSFLKQIGKQLGDVVDVGFQIGDQDSISMPEELADVLNDHPRQKSVWDALTPGKQRGFCHRINSAKRAETREKRVFEVLDELSDLAS